MIGMSAKKKKLSSADNPWPETLRILRATLGMHQDQAAERADVAVGTWRNWEQGRRQPSKFVAAFLEAAFPEFDFVKRKKKKG